MATNTNKIVIDYYECSGSNMNCWHQEIGEYCNHIIPKHLKDELISQCKILIGDKQKMDYRNPDLTNKNTLKNIQIQDIIEPCTPLWPFQDIENERKQDEERENEKVKSDLIIDNIYTYIPAVFELNKEKDLYQIKSEINDLSYNHHPKLYSIIQQIFNKMEPMIERCINIYPNKVEQGNNIFGKINVETMKVTNIVQIENEAGGVMKFDFTPDREFLFDKYYVIVKMTDYQFLSKDDSSYGGGNFHSEGFQNEFIKAVALYYFDITNSIHGGGLTFRDKTNENFGKDCIVDIKDNDCVVFTNCEPYRHKVNRMRIVFNDNNDNDMDKNGNIIYGSRKLLGFFIVDPERYHDIVTSKDVAVNIWSKIDYIIGYWLRKELGNEIEMSQDLDTIITSYIYHMTDIKNKTDEYRKQRYEFGKTIRNREKQILDQRRFNGGGIVD